MQNVLDTSTIKKISGTISFKGILMSLNNKQGYYPNFKGKITNYLYILLQRVYEIL